MPERLTFCVAGGDRRALELAKLLRTDGHRVGVFALPDDKAQSLPPEKLAGADCVVLPVPVLGAGGVLNAPLAARPVAAETLLEALRPGQTVCGGKITPPLAAAALARGLTLHDYAAREDFMVYNAVPTAFHKQACNGKESGLMLRNKRQYYLNVKDRFQMPQKAGQEKWAVVSFAQSEEGFAGVDIDTRHATLCAPGNKNLTTKRKGIFQYEKSQENARSGSGPGPRTGLHGHGEQRQL